MNRTFREFVDQHSKYNASHCSQNQPESAPKRADKAESSQQDAEPQLPAASIRKSSVVQFRKDGSLDYDGKMILL